jgi:hypothetical protein
MSDKFKTIERIDVDYQQVVDDLEKEGFRVMEEKIEELTEEVKVLKATVALMQEAMQFAAVKYNK